MNITQYFAKGEYDPTELIAECGTIKLRGKDLKCRKGVEFGARVYKFIPSAEKPIPVGLRKFIEENGIPITPKIQVVVHYYEKGGSIGSHSDKIGKLEEGSKIYSISFLLDNHPSTMSWENEDYYWNKTLRHKEFLVWNSKEHWERKIKHEVKDSGKRINITIRTSK